MSLIVLVSLSVNVCLTLIQYPQPRIHDEFAYQLAADTYASGRLTNPTHPHWKHFETFHVLSQPSYNAKYPPGNGLFLAAGQRLTGHSLAGSWIAMALGLAALYWMMSAWIPSPWALSGSLLLAINTPMLMAWGQTWWGGGVPLLGGCLVFGAMKRLLDHGNGNCPVWRYASTFSCGAVLLALSRPLEGLIACTVAGTMLMYWLIRSPAPMRGRRWVQLSLPCLVIGGAGMGMLLVNNLAVTGRATTLPYSVHSSQYSATSLCIWQPLPAVPEYNLPRMETLYVNWSRARQKSARTVSGYMALAKSKLILLWRFFPLAGGLCLVPVLLMVGKNRSWWWLFAGLICILLVVELQLVHSFAYPHYLAPFACLFYVMMFHGLRCWKIISRDHSFVRPVVPALVIYSCLTVIALPVWTTFQSTPTARSLAEARLAKEPGRHLVFVDYSKNHNPLEEWVYNRAEIDESDIVWANVLSRDENESLMQYFSERKVWVWNVEQVESELVPYRDSNRFRITQSQHGKKIWNKYTPVHVYE